MEVSTKLYRPASHTRIHTSHPYLSSALKSNQREIITSDLNKPNRTPIDSSDIKRYDQENQTHFKLAPNKNDRIDKLIRIDKIQASNIDQLNLKITSMVNKLTIEQNPTFSFVKEK